MSTTSNIFVQGNVEAQIADLATYIGKLRGQEDYAVDAKNEGVYAQLAQDCSVLLTENNRKVEGAFNLLIVVLLTAPQTVLAAAVQIFVDTLTKTESNKTSLKQKILLNLYNALPGNSPLRYNAFIGLVEATKQADELESLYGQLEYVDAWTKQWGIDQATQCNLYTYLSQVLQEAGQDKLALEFSLKTLSTYDATEGQTLAKQVVSRAIEMENYFAFEDLLQYSAIQQLQGLEKDLLDVFLNGTLATYKQFAQQHNLNNEGHVHKMRLLSLASLGSEHLSRELTYAEIAQQLEIPEEEVEMWVIDVIRAGLVEAKLDQLNKTVIVHRSIYRVFGQEQWKKLSTSLSAWKENLNEILAVVGNAKLIAGGAPSTAVLVEGGDK